MTAPAWELPIKPVGRGSLPNYFYEKRPPLSDDPKPPTLFNGWLQKGKIDDEPH